METRTLQIELLTPLWTANAEKKGGTILETGILGSLRWWYEAILRGLGFDVCDPSRRTCSYDEEKGNSSVCLACQLFGGSGYSRRFRLVIDEGGSGNTGKLVVIKLSNPGSKEHRGWRIPGENSAEPLRLSFLPMRRGGLDEIERVALRYTLALIERFGALGAKTSQGQGAIRIKDWGELPVSTNFDKWYEALDKKKRLKQEPEVHESDTEAVATEKAICIPDIRNMVGATVVLEDAKLTPKDLWPKLGLTANTANYVQWLPEATTRWLPSAPAVRTKLRAWLRDSNNVSGFDEDGLASERHRLMGTTAGWDDPCPQNSEKGIQDRPKGSDVFVTHLYRESYNEQWTMRIFAFIPRDGNEVDRALRTLLMDPNKLKAVLQAALGGLAVQINPYPTDIKALLVDGERSDE